MSSLPRSQCHGVAAFIQAPVEQVWQTLTDPQMSKAYFIGATVEVGKQGGRYAVTPDGGEVTKLTVSEFVEGEVPSGRRAYRAGGIDLETGGTIRHLPSMPSPSGASGKS
jgi:hypothetical protein